MTKPGDKDEILIQTWLEMHGYLVHRAAATGRIKIGPRWIQKSHDLFGCIDLLAIKSSRELVYGECKYETIAIQVTTKTNRAARRKKVYALVARWPRSWHVAVVVHGWDRCGRSTRHYLRFEDLVNSVWFPQDEVEIDPDAIKAWRKAQSQVSL